MQNQKTSPRLDPAKLSALDAPADYLDAQQWQLREILAGIAEAGAGQVIDHSKMKAMAARWRPPDRS